MSGVNSGKTILGRNFDKMASFASHAPIDPMVITKIEGGRVYVGFEGGVLVCDDPGIVTQGLQRMEIKFDR